MIITNWYVLTGAPRSGKTKIIERLSYLNYKICPEIARLLIDEYNSSNTIKNFKTTSFENEIFYEKILAEKRFNSEEIVFFDRCPIDSIAFAKLYNRPYKKFIKDIKYRYKKVFFIESLGIYTCDYTTLESEDESQKLVDLLFETYSKFGYEIVTVPKMPISNRAKFILTTTQ